MSEWDQFDHLNNGNEGENTTPDTYTTENSADIYNTPNVIDSPSEDAFDGEVQNTAETDAVVPYNNPYGGQPRNDLQGNPYIPGPNNNPYNHNPYSNQYNGNPYGNNPYNNNQYNNNPYSGNPYGGQPQNDNPYSGNPYSGQPQNDNPYSGNPYAGQPQNDNPYYSNPYGGQPQNGGQGNPYNHNPYSNDPSGIPPYNNNQFSPYAAPPKKNKNGLIIGIVVAVIVLFLIAVFALVYKAFTLADKDDDRSRNEREEYRFDDDDDDWGVERRKKNKDPEPDDRDDDDDDYDDDDYYDDDWYDDWYDDYYDDDWYDDYDDEYYDLHDDIRWDLSYSVDFEDYEIDDGDIAVLISYPVIEGDDVPNLRKLNQAIQDEVGFLQDLGSDADEGEGFTLIALVYVTYMDEEKLSIVFDERIYTDYKEDYYLYSLNIDMENGVVLDNQSLINANDDFSIEFRERSDIQNGESIPLSRMTDQEITKHFNSSDIIIFYTPMGMEIGFNHDTGWITVTYEDYEKYLKVF